MSIGVISGEAIANKHPKAYNDYLLSIIPDNKIVDGEIFHHYNDIVMLMSMSKSMSQPGVGDDTPLQIKVSMRLTKPDLLPKQELDVFHTIKPTDSTRRSNILPKCLTSHSINNHFNNITTIITLISTNHR